MRNDNVGAGYFGADRNTTQYGMHTGVDYLGDVVYAPMKGELWLRGSGYNSTGVISGTNNGHRVDIILQHTRMLKTGPVQKGDVIGFPLQPSDPEMLIHTHVEIQYYPTPSNMFYINPEHYFGR